jgi:hypothetical protein
MVFVHVIVPVPATAEMFGIPIEDTFTVDPLTEEHPFIGSVAITV